MQPTGKVVFMKGIHNLNVSNAKSNMTMLQRAVNELPKTNGTYVKLHTENRSENLSIYLSHERYHTGKKPYSGKKFKVIQIEFET